MIRNALLILVSAIFCEESFLLCEKPTQKENSADLRTELSCRFFHLDGLVGCQVVPLLL